MQCQGEFQIFISSKEKGDVTIEMYLRYVVVFFYWNVFDIYIQMLSDYTLI